MPNPQLLMQQRASIKTLRNQIHNLEECVSNLLELTGSISDGEIRNKYCYEISALDSIAETMK